MDALNLLDKALERLKNTSPKDVKSRSKKCGIVIPEEPKLKDWADHFVVDFGGLFKEAVNSKRNQRWLDPELLGNRKSITVKNKKSHQQVALSF